MLSINHLRWSNSVQYILYSTPNYVLYAIQYTIICIVHYTVHYIMHCQLYSESYAVYAIRVATYIIRYIIKDVWSMVYDACMIYDIVLFDTLSMMYDLWCAMCMHDVWYYSSHYIRSMIYDLQFVRYLWCIYDIVVFNKYIYQISSNANNFSYASSMLTDNGKN